MKKTALIISMILLLFIIRGDVYAQSGVQVQVNEVELQFPQGVVFQLEAKNGMDIETVTLVYGTNGSSCQATTARRPVEFVPATDIDLTWEWDWSRSGILPPGSKLWWQWEIHDQSGETLVTAQKTITIKDHRHTWKRLDRNGVILQWYLGDDAFGETLMGIAAQSLRRLENDMGVRPKSDITISVYPTSDELHSAVIGSTDWVGGLAFTDYNSIIISVSPGELEWAASVIPHELGHLVVDTLVYNCHGVWLPTWLSEGLAEMAEGSPSPEQCESVKLVLEDGELTPLKRLARGFSAYGDEAALAYLQSGCVVDYLIQEYGKENLGELLATIQMGTPVDSALEYIYGFDTNGLDEAWRKSLGVSQTDDEVHASDQYQEPGQAKSVPAFTPVPTYPIMVIDPTATTTATTILTPTRTPVPTIVPDTPTVTATAVPLTPTQTPSTAQGELALMTGETGPLLGCTSILVTVSILGCLLLLGFLLVLRVKRI